MRKSFLAAIIFVALSLAAAAMAQEVTVRWHRTAPEMEAFSVLMPEPPLRVRRVIPFSEELKAATPVYELAHRGVLFSVFSVDKKRVTAFKTPDDFANGLRHAIRHSSRTTDSELTFEREVTLNNQTAKQFLVRAEGKTGTAQIYETITHYYVLMTLGAQASESLASHFFNSFTTDVKNAREASDRVSITQNFSQMPPRAPEPLWPVAGSESAVGEIAGPIGPMGPDSSNAPSAGETSKTPMPSNTVRGGVFNGKADSKPQPTYPPIARAARAQGTVAVEVIVDEEGYVISARAASGHPLLQNAAVQAARQARFAPTLLSGVPVKVMGIITYNFVLAPAPDETPTRKY